MTIHGSGITSTGPVYESNQDAFLVDNENLLFIVCDGSGKAGSGHKASNLAVEKIHEHVLQSLSDVADGIEETEALLFAKSMLKKALQRASKAVYDLMEQGQVKGQVRTTATVALVHHNHLILAHVGNSRIWLVRDRQAHILTHDHTLVEDLVKRGVLDEKKARDSEVSHVLTRSLGASEHINVETLVFRLIPHDRILLTTDGFSDVVDSEEELLSWVSEGEEFLCSHLMQSASEKNQRDDVTIVTIECDSEVEALPVDAATTVDTIDLMRRVFIFNELPLRDILLILSKVWQFETQTDEVVVHEGDYSDVMYIILAGSYQVFQDETKLATLGRGDHFGEMAILHEAPRSASIRCQSAGTLLALDRQVFQRLVRKHPHLGVHLLGKISSQLCRRLEKANLLRGY